MYELLVTGFLLGLGGSLHCVGMCGTIVTALSFGTRNQSFARTSVIALFNNLGRMSTYMLLGVLAGLISQSSEHLGALLYLRIAAAILMILVGLYLLQWWNGLLVIEKAGLGLWKKIQPIASKINPSRSVFHAWISGMIWGLIPCGLVYSALGIALAKGSVENSLGFMAAFGLGTLFPMLLMAVGFSSIAQWLKKPLFKWLVSFSMIGFGVWSLVMLAMHSGHGANHSGHNNHKNHDPQQMQNMDHSAHKNHKPNIENNKPNDDDKSNEHHHHH